MRERVSMTKENKIRTRSIMFMSGGLIAISLVILQGLITLTSFDTAQFISIIAFSVAIPMLAGVIVICQSEMSYKCLYHLWSDITFGCFIIGSISAFIGIAAILWHLSWIASSVFLGVSLLMGNIAGRYVTKDGFKLQEEEGNIKSQ